MGANPPPVPEGTAAACLPRVENCPLVRDSFAAPFVWLYRMHRGEGGGGGFNTHICKNI